jgi:4-hydroxy-tetrahydrodipicolinate synthase
LIGCEEILFPSVLMGADGGTIASSGVVPEVIVRLYRESVAGNIPEARRIQLKLLDLINTMLFGTNFPEGFRAGMSLRGFDLGTTRQLLSPREQTDLEEIRGKIACILAECGFMEAASACRSASSGVTSARISQTGGGETAGTSRFSARNTVLTGINVDQIVHEVLKTLGK